MWSGTVAQRIEMGLEMAERAVGVDEMVNARLLEAVDDRCGGMGLRFVIRRSHERGDGGGAVGAKREALKEGAPRGVDRVVISQPRLIGRLDDVDVGMC